MKMKILSTVFLSGIKLKIKIKPKLYLAAPGQSSSIKLSMCIWPCLAAIWTGISPNSSFETSNLESKDNRLKSGFSVNYYQYVFSARLFSNVAYSLCAPMYKKCHILSIRVSKIRKWRHWL